jgi:hypothetical protein
MHNAFMALIIVLAVALQGCSTYGPSDEFIGLQRQSIAERMGPPTDERQGLRETILEYARGPAGRHTYFLTFGPDGRLSKWEQVLKVENFEKIKPDMTTERVKSLIGTSFAVSQLGRNRGEVWSYRYENDICVWFQVEFSADGRVRSAGNGIPPECLTPNE